MNKKIVPLSLFLVFLMCTMIATVSAQRVPGVQVGNWFKYGATVTWSSTDPNAKMPDYLKETNATEWMLGTITNVVGTNVTGQTLTHYKNGTEETEGAYIDVETGEGENATLWLIAADLQVNDAIYTTGSYSSWRINETITRTYPGGDRETNHVNFTMEYNYPPILIISVSQNYYWDKATGAMVEVSAEFFNQTASYLTTWSELIEITESNVWLVPEFPTLASILLVFIAFPFAIIVCKRRLLKASNH
jgi:hypothetical protein